MCVVCVSKQDCTIFGNSTTSDRRALFVDMAFVRRVNDLIVGFCSCGRFVCDAAAWRCSKHESFRGYIFNSIAEVVECARLPQIRHFWNLVAQSPTDRCSVSLFFFGCRCVRLTFVRWSRSIDEVFVAFVKEFTQKALKQARSQVSVCFRVH